MKILFVVPSLTLGGMERMQVTLANALHRAGHAITILTLNPDHTLGLELDAGIRLIYKPYKEFPIRRKLKYIWTFYDDGRWEKRASPQRLHRYYVGKEKYDVEIGFFRGLPIKIVSGAYRKKKSITSISRKSVGTQKKNTDFEPEIVVHLAWVHTDFEKAIGYQNGFKNLRDVFKAYKSMDHVICVSNQAQEGFKKTIGDTGNLVTVYNVLPVEEIRKKAELKPEIAVNREKFHVVLVGRLLDSAKGQKRLISVVAKLHNEGYPISLALVGGGGDETLLRDEIQKYIASSYITMTGNQMNPYPYIKEADLLVCASYFEGFNLTVAEAIIIGTPVLSTNCTGPNEVLDSGKYGMIVENSEEGLYGGLKQFLETPELLDDYRKRADKREAFFDEDRLLKQITRLFE